jgi:trans-2,3-dihydro-3-hydroxyanthranilate isomerase
MMDGEPVLSPAFDFYVTMKSYPFVTLDVFTNHRFGGNPLAVFYDATGLTKEQMQSLTKEMNLSETTFVLPPMNPAHAARVRIFNTTAEMPFAGHPTVGTGFVLAQRSNSRDGMLSLEVEAGTVDVTVHRAGSGAVTGTTIVAPQPLTLGNTVSASVVAECANLELSDVVETNHRPTVASTGFPFVVAEVTHRALGRAEPVFEAFRRAVADHAFLNGNFDLHLYARAEHRIRARMFAPLGGTTEDPATGSANAALGAFLLSLTRDERGVYEITQGVEMGRPSFLKVEAWRKGEDIHAAVGGDCVPMFSGEVRI